MMKRTAIILFIFFIPVLAFSIPQEIEKALKLNRINHFDEALQLVEHALATEKIKPDITSAYTIGRILFRKGELYREMADISIRGQIDYLAQIEGRGAPLPPELGVFQGIGHFFHGEYLESAAVLSGVSEKPMEGELKELALVYLGAAYYLSDEKQRAQNLWKNIDEDTPYAYGSLGFVYSYLEINPSEGESHIRTALEKTGRFDSNYNSLKIYHAYALLKAGSFSEAYTEAAGIELDDPLFVYGAGTTEMRFYDPAVLMCYSRILFGESIKSLEPIVSASSGELASFAAYYVAQMYLYLGDYEECLQFTARAQKLSVSSSLTMIRAVSCEACTHILLGKEKKGYRIIQKEISRIRGKPSTLLEMIRVITTSGVRYELVRDVLAEIESYIYEMEWERTRRDTALLGELSFFSERYVRALYYFERARDKGNKNKIETNDPAFLLKLSYIYYTREYFSESLEILFSLGKSFSGIRPLQDAVQSVYSYKQRGSGETILE